MTTATIPGTGTSTGNTGTGSKKRPYRTKRPVNYCNKSTVTTVTTTMATAGAVGENSSGGEAGAAAAASTNQNQNNQHSYLNAFDIVMQASTGLMHRQDVTTRGGVVVEVASAATVSFLSTVSFSSSVSDSTTCGRGNAHTPSMPASILTLCNSQSRAGCCKASSKFRLRRLVLVVVSCSSLLFAAAQQRRR